MISERKEESNSEIDLRDIRYKDFLKLNTKAALALKKIIEAEDYLISLDDYQMAKGQIYPEIEDMMLQLGGLRKDYTEFLERHPEVLMIKDDEID